MPRGVGASTYKHIMVATCLGWFVFLLRRLNPPKYREPGAQYTGNTRRKKRDVPGIKFRLPIYSCALGECTQVGWHQFRHDVQSSARHTRQGNQVKTISIDVHLPGTTLLSPGNDYEERTSAPFLVHRTPNQPNTLYITKNAPATSDLHLPRNQCILSSNTAGLLAS